MECPAGDIALRYKELLMVEQIFRSMKTILETRLIYYKTTQSIRGHVFCSFLALILLKELQDRMYKRGWKSEWAQVCEELNDLEEFTVETPGKNFVIRSRVGTEAGKAIQSAGVTLGTIVRFQNP
jgi:transposase